MSFGLIGIWQSKTAFIGKNCQNGRSSHQRFSVKKGALKNYTKFTGKHLGWESLFNKVAGLKAFFTTETSINEFTT